MRSSPARWSSVYVLLIVASVGGEAFAPDLSPASTWLYRLLVGLCGVLPTAFLAWRTLRKDDADTGWSLDVAAKRLVDYQSEKVGEQWAQQGFNERLPLTVSWQVAEQDLFDGWSAIVTAAGAAHPGRAWPARPQYLGRADGNLRATLADVPTGRLVVLGGLGTGKSSLLLQLMRAMLKSAGDGKTGRIPVLVQLASWDPNRHDLPTWLERTLAAEAGVLRRPVLVDQQQVNPVRELFSRGRLLLVLDGLDEMPQESRGSAITEINRLEPDRPFVVSSRIPEYQAAAAQAASLHYAAAIELRPPRPADVADYLTEHGSAAQRERWAPVLALLGTDAPVGTVLDTPLMAYLARTAYSQGVLRDPIDLIAHGDKAKPGKDGSITAADRVEAIERYLFSAYLDAKYAARARSVKQAYRPDRARRWLTTLAGQLENRPDDTVNLAWWDLPAALPWSRVLVGLAVGLPSALITGLAAGLGTHVGSGFGLGLGAGICVALAVGLPIYWFRRSRQRPLQGLAFGLAGGFLGGVLAGALSMIGFGFAPGLFGGVAGGLGVGVAAGPTSGRLGGFVGAMAGGLVAGCLAGVGSGLPAGLINGLGVGLGAGLIAALSARPAPAQGVRWSPVGLIGGLAAGSAVGAVASIQAGLEFGVIAGAVIWGLSGLAAGLSRVPAPWQDSVSPRTSMARDRAAFAIAGLGGGGAVGACTLVIVGVAAAHEVHAVITVPYLLANGWATGVSVGLVCGLVLAVVQTSWGAYVVTLWWYALRGRLPWRLLRFLADAHQPRHILRRVGTRYQFWHRELQRHLAPRRETQHAILTRDFLLPPINADRAGYRFARPDVDDPGQLHPYVELLGGDPDSYARWLRRCPESFLHLEKYENGGWRPIAVSIILPLRADALRAITHADARRRDRVEDLPDEAILPGLPPRGRRNLLLHAWLVSHDHRGHRHGKSETGGGYANTLLLRHIAEFWHPDSSPAHTTFVAETTDATVAAMLQAMTFTRMGESSWYITDTATFESEDDTKFRELTSVLAMLTRPQSGTGIEQGTRADPAAQDQGRTRSATSGR